MPEFPSELPSESAPLPPKLDEEAAGGEFNPADIRRAAMDLLARRDHSVRELRSKLRRRFADEETIDQQLARLIEERLQSDVRFAASFARQRISRGYGPLRLREELRERGVSADDIAAAMVELDVDWHAIATDVLHKKFGPLAATDLKEKARRIRFMQYRGFSADQYKSLERNQ